MPPKRSRRATKKAPGSRRRKAKPDPRFRKLVEQAVVGWRPAVFVGSAGESLAAARAIKLKLKRGSGKRRIVFWTNAFDPSSMTLTRLIELTQSSDFGVLVGGADDELKIKGRTYSAIRDNVLFEFGLFSGALGLGRSVLLTPRHANLRIPTDLDGMTLVKYDPDDPSRAARKLLRHLSNVEQGLRGRARESVKAFVESPEFISARRLEDVSLSIVDLSDKLQAELDRGVTPFTSFRQFKRAWLRELERLQRDHWKDLEHLGLTYEGRHMFGTLADAVHRAPAPADLGDELLPILFARKRERGRLLRRFRRAGRDDSDPGWREGVDRAAQSMQRFTSEYYDWFRRFRRPVISAVAVMSSAIAKAVGRKVTERANHLHLRLGLALWQQYQLTDGRRPLSLSEALRPRLVVPDMH